MSAEFQLNITPLQLTDLPSEEQVVAAAKALLDTTPKWKKGKVHHKIVQTYSHPKGPHDGAPWHCRVSEHGPEDATFDEFWSKLGVDHSENEVQYIPTLKKATHIKDISPNQSIWSMYYVFPPPVSPRVFTILVTTHLEPGSDVSPKTGWIISNTVDLSSDGELAKLEEKGVKGRYVSIERIKQLDDNKVEWRMAVSSSPGGMIPPFISEGSMDGQISKDVPLFLKWFHSGRDKAEATGNAPPSSDADTSAAEEDTNHPHTIVPNDVGEGLPTGAFKSST